MAVVPEHRDKGYAGMLVAGAERALREQGIAVFAALIETDNEASLTVFRGFGYALLPYGICYLSKRGSEDD